MKHLAILAFTAFIATIGCGVSTDESAFTGTGGAAVSTGGSVSPGAGGTTTVTSTNAGTGGSVSCTIPGCGGNTASTTCTGGSPGTGGTTASTPVCSASTVGTKIVVVCGTGNCIATCQKTGTVDGYDWVIDSVPTATGGASGSGGSSGVGGSSAVPVGTDQPCSAVNKSLVCEDRWVAGRPAQSCLMIWGGPAGAPTKILSAADQNGLYYWPTDALPCGIYTAWYTSADCSIAAANGASYGANAVNWAQVSESAKVWLTCMTPGATGIDIRFQVSCTDRLVRPAGCGSGL